MGILGGPLQFLKELPLQPGFSVCELGDQYITHGTPHRLAREFYEQDLGCSRYESVDGNARGTLTADLNRPLVSWDFGLHRGHFYNYENWFGRFDLVTDFGTGEHIFDQAQVWRTIHDLCKAPGFIVFDRPISGYAVHGFYSINECLLRDLAAANEYEVQKLHWSKTSRGKLMRGVFKKVNAVPFANPQQGRYEKILRPLGKLKARSAAIE